MLYLKLFMNYSINDTSLTVLSNNLIRRYVFQLKTIWIGFN